MLGGRNKSGEAIRRHGVRRALLLVALYGAALLPMVPAATELLFVSSAPPGGCRCAAEAEGCSRCVASQCAHCNGSPEEPRDATPRWMSRCRCAQIPGLVLGIPGSVPDHLSSPTSAPAHPGDDRITWTECSLFTSDAVRHPPEKIPIAPLFHIG